MKFGVLTRALFLAALLTMVGCNERLPRASFYVWDLPAHFAEPVVPDDNPMSFLKVQLGRLLFYDTRLSSDGSMSCGSCHQQELAFTDGQAVSSGVTGEQTPRGSMSLANIAYASKLTWANPLIERLEHQAQIPMFGEEPVEMGWGGREKELLQGLAVDEEYQKLFARVFSDADPLFTVENITRAIASFERTLISGNSRYDRFVNGDKTALSKTEQLGLDLFLSERLECFHCHAGFTFTDSVDHTGMPLPEASYHNTGLYNLDGNGAYPAANTGVFAISGEPLDMGSFKAPTLRNIAVTAPYMHDGSIETLEGVLDHYGAGGRHIASGGNAGRGSENPLKSQFVPGFVLNSEEKLAVLAFLSSLTDEAFLTDPRFADPFAKAPTN
jgi:cytochrome c peroxidase